MNVKMLLPMAKAVKWGFYMDTHTRATWQVKEGYAVRDLANGKFIRHIITVYNDLFIVYVGGAVVEIAAGAKLNFQYYV